MNRLVITLDNIPDGIIEEAWNRAITAAPASKGVQINIKPTENIYYDFNKILELITYAGVQRMLAAMITPNVIQIHHRNKTKGQ